MDEKSKRKNEKDGPGPRKTKAGPRTPKSAPEAVPARRTEPAAVAIPGAKAPKRRETRKATARKADAAKPAAEARKAPAPKPDPKPARKAPATYFAAKDAGAIHSADVTGLIEA